MGGPVVVQGALEDESGLPVTNAQVCLSIADQPTGSTSTDSNGNFQLEAPAGVENLLTILAPGLEAWRRRLAQNESAVNLGRITMVASEYPSGILGQVWDVVRGVPLTRGRVRLRRGGETVRTEVLEIDGSFSIEMSSAFLLPPGSYELTFEVSGYGELSHPLEVSDLVTSYIIGRVELEPSESRV